MIYVWINVWEIDVREVSAMKGHGRKTCRITQSKQIS